MPSNRDWLFSLPLEEQLAWMSAEHVEGVEIQGEVCDFEHEPDSREKLEADIHAWLTSHVAVSVYASEVEEAVRGWLDRQAAITERKMRDELKAEAELYAARVRRISELQAKVDKLTADLKDEGHIVNELSDENLALKAENDELRDKLSAAIGHAHATCALVDLEGNVV